MKDEGGSVWPLNAVVYDYIEKSKEELNLYLINKYGQKQVELDSDIDYFDLVMNVFINFIFIITIIINILILYNYNSVTLYFLENKRKLS